MSSVDRRRGITRESLLQYAKNGTDGDGEWQRLGREKVMKKTKPDERCTHQTLPGEGCRP